MNAAKMGKVSIPEMPKPKDTMHISCGPDSKNMPGCALGDTVTLVVKGKVTSLHADQYGKSFDMDVKSVQPEDDYEEKT